MDALLGLVVIIFALLLAIFKGRKRKKEDEFLNGVDYAYRPQEIRTKPKSGKRRTKDEIRHDRDATQKAAGVNARKIARADMIKAKRVGSPGYIWHSIGEGACECCAKNNGKKFRWDKPPETGHPGEGKLCKNGHCKCWAEVIIPLPKK